MVDRSERNFVAIWTSVVWPHIEIVVLDYKVFNHHISVRHNKSMGLLFFIYLEAQSAILNWII